MPYKIVGISGSPVKNGNTDTFLASIMSSAEEKGLEAETVNLSEMEIKNCIHCNFCLTKQQAGKYHRTGEPGLFYANQRNDGHLY
jgi:multimeric flavodoxin WrbA